MNYSNRIILSVIMGMAVACGGSNNGGGSGDDQDEVAAAAFNGDYEGIATFSTNIRVVELGSNTPPAEADCIGDVAIIVDDAATDVLVGDGQCLLPANVATYELVGEFLNGTDFEGVMTIRFSGVDHVLDFAGTRDVDELSGSFAARTPQVGNLVIDWDGTFTAVRPPR